MDDLTIIKSWLKGKNDSWDLGEGTEIWRQDGMNGGKIHDLMIILYEIQHGTVLAGGDRDLHEKHQTMFSTEAMAELTRLIFEHCQRSEDRKPTEEWLDSLDYEALQSIVLGDSLYGGGSTNRRKRRKTKKRRKSKKRKSKKSRRKTKRRKSKRR